MIMDAMAACGVPNQFTPCAASPVRVRTQLITLKVGSNIQRQASVLSTVGMMNGRSRAARTNRCRGKAWLRSKAMTSPSTSLKTVVHAV